ncbi:MAG: TatD family hydrolase [Lachnospiraceae bacterium]|nr:TatD family hydrolase [Lachnospiraceae bacterium]
MFYDTHAHFHHKLLKNKTERIVSQLKETKVSKIIEVPISFDSNFEIRDMLADYGELFSYAAGVHPNQIHWEEILDKTYEQKLRNVIETKPTIAIGETGLDFYRCEDLEQQKRQEVWFRKQIEFAIQYKLPLIIHVRQAHHQVISILQEYQHALSKQISGVIHCFVGDIELALQYEALGFKIGIGGRVSHTDEMAQILRETVKQLSLESIVLETDAPYLKPEGCKGKVNSPLNLPVICDVIAELKNVSRDEVAKVTLRNAKEVFGWQG